MRRLSAEVMAQLNPSEARRVRRASVVGETEAAMFASLTLKLKRMSDERFTKFVRRFRKAVHGGDVTFRAWLNRLVTKQGLKISDIDEQLLRDEVFRHLKPYLHNQ
jgi:hypothetical protein